MEREKNQREEQIKYKEEIRNQIKAQFETQTTAQLSQLLEDAEKQKKKIEDKISSEMKESKHLKGEVADVKRICRQQIKHKGKKSIN